MLSSRSYPVTQWALRVVNNACCLFLKALSDIQIAVKMAQSNADSDEHPLDSQYHSLQCKLQPLDSSSHEYKVSLLFIRGVTVHLYLGGPVQTLGRAQ